MKDSKNLIITKHDHRNSTDLIILWSFSMRCEEETKWF